MLVGLDPGVTVTVSTVVPPALTVEGFAAPTPVGLVELVQRFVVEALLRGFGELAAKSVELLLLSVQPFDPRKIEAVLLPAGAVAEPSKQFAVAPNPTKS